MNFFTLRSLQYATFPFLYDYVSNRLQKEYIVTYNGTIATYIT
jgi:hypothetical protein